MAQHCPVTEVCVAMQAWRLSVLAADTPPSNTARMTEIHALAVKLIHELLSVDLAKVDTAIHDCLARLGQFSARDRAYVFLHRENHVSNTHEWCAPGIAPAIDALQDLPTEDFASLLDPLMADGVLLIADINAFPPGSSEHEVLKAQQIRSLLLVPMIEQGALFGFVGFDSVSRSGNFLPEEIYLLQAFADVVRSVLLRKSAAEELARERAFLQGIVSTTATGLMVLDSRGVIIFANDASAEMVGVPVSDLLGQRTDSLHWRVTHPDGTPLAPEDRAFAKVRASGGNITNHRVAFHDDSGTRYVSINAAPIRTGGVQAFVCFSRSPMSPPRSRPSAHARRRLPKPAARARRSRLSWPISAMSCARR